MPSKKEPVEIALTTRSRMITEWSNEDGPEMPGMMGILTEILTASISKKTAELIKAKRTIAALRGQITKLKKKGGAA